MISSDMPGLMAHKQTLVLLIQPHWEAMVPKRGEEGTPQKCLGSFVSAVA